MEELFFILWVLIFVGIIAMIIRKGGKGGGTQTSINDTKTALDEDMFTDPAWRNSSVNMFH